MKTILCLADFSFSSENAVNYAYELAQLLRTRLLLFHNIPAPAIAEAEALYTDSHSQLTAQLEVRNAYIGKLEKIKRRLAYFQPDAQVPCHMLVKQGLAKETIPALLQEEQVDLLVMGNEEADALRNVFTGTVAADMIERAFCPVLVVPQGASFKPLRTIVYAVDQIGERYQD